MYNLKCCFIGHRQTPETEELKLKLFSIIENLIISKNVDTFLFGSKSRFNDICYDVVSELKIKYPHIKRIYVRSMYQNVDGEYGEYLLERYEYTYYPENLLNSGKAVYVKRNYEMIQKSDICVFYYNEQYAPKSRKSGTKVAYNYAKTKKKEIILL